MLSKRQQSLIDKAVALEFEDAQASGATGYLPYFLAQATLPHKDPKCTYFERGTSKVTLSIMAHRKYGMPYGMMPRLLLAWMCTEACRTHSPELDLGRNQKEFLKKLQLPSDGRYIKILHKQTLALVRSQISIEISSAGAVAFENIQIAKNGFAVHPRSFARDPLVCDPWHYLAVLEKKPGALRNGAPFVAWDLPLPIKQVQERILKQPHGDRAFVELLLVAREVGLEPLQVACELALECGVVRGSLVMNELRRLIAPPRPTQLTLPEQLQLRVEPLADCHRYEQLRGTAYVH